MMEMIEANWWLIALALVIGLLVAWYLFRVNRTTHVTGETGDVLDEGASPAARNQALIDSNRNQAEEPTVERIAQETSANTQRAETHPGALSAAADSTKVAAAPADADAEAGEAIPAREAIKAAPAEASTPAETASPAAGTKNSQGDDLTRLKGVGPKLAAMLADMGVDSLNQIAGWSDADIDRIDGQLGRFQGRIRRDDWVTQARLLSANDRAGYEAKFGKLD